MTIKTSHLDIKFWTDYASGTVDGVYPNPVEADTIIDLAVFEASDHGASYVNITLGNKFSSGYMGKDMAYKAATIGNLKENEFNTVQGTMNQSIIGEGHDIGFRANMRYQYQELFSERAKTVSELLLKLAARKVTGSLHINFLNYPNGPRCHSESVRKFNICL